MFKSNKAWQTLAVVAVFVLSLPMTACSQSSSVRSGEQWQPVCLDRFVIEVPPSVEVGASNVVYQGGYNFPGVKSIGATGIKWNGATLDETHVTDTNGFEAIYLSAARALPNAKPFIETTKQEIQSREDDIRRWKKQLASGTGTADERVDTQRMIDSTSTEIQDIIRTQKVSGIAQMSSQDAFAVRRRDTYSVGYLDPTDHRVRYFEGQLSPSEAAIESPEVAAQEFERFRRIYHRRDVNEIPTTPGYCTAHGFIDEPAGYKPQEGDALNLPFRSLKYPNLVFILIVDSANPNRPRNAMEQENPNVVTTKDLQNLKGMAAAGALAALGQIKRTYGPKRIEMAGQSGGRLYGREYHNKGYLEENGPATAYEFEAEVMGEPGRTDRPHIKLQMGAALADAPDLPKGQEPIRPALKGQVPPSFEEGLKIFEEVVKSVRLRPVVQTGDAAVGVIKPSKDQRASTSQ